MFVLFVDFNDLSKTKRMSSSLSGLMWTCYLLLFLIAFNNSVRCEIDYNTINDDGSFSFRHTNDDIGSYYHSASGSPENIVRGRYGSRNPATGQVEEVVYTAGPRGFRANGPKIHRKMDLSQYPPRPIGSPDDPLADPYDDPSYSFSFRTSDHSRTESSDSTGRVRGLYSYLDDVGERHTVRYAAGAGTGYEVSNSVPDNPASVAYSAPLYKAHPKTRGKMSVQRGPNGSYKLIAAGPDHRRAESRGPDGLVRGTYSYLDDKGVQRTVEYVAGAGIGYRVVHNQIGPGTHINPSVSDFRLSDTDFKLSNEYGRSEGGGGAGADSGRGDESDGEYLHTSGTGRTRSKSNDDDFKDDSRDNSANGVGSSSGRRGSGDSSSDREGGGNKSDRTGTAAEGRGSTRYRGGSVGSGGSGTGGSRRTNDDEDYMPDSSRDTPKIGGRGGSRPTSNRNSVNTDERTRNRQRDRNRDSSRFGSGDRGGGASTGGSRRGGYGGSSSNRGGYDYNTPSTSSNNYNFKDDDVGSLPPLITPNRKILEIERERDWVQRHHDSTIIKNVGKWYIGLPPGQSVRAHVQNIDLLPLGGRHVLSPSEALRQDEIADMVASLETETSHSS